MRRRPPAAGRLSIRRVAERRAPVTRSTVIRYGPAGWEYPDWAGTVAGDAIAAALPVGAEVLAVDGRAVLEAGEDLTREIPSSSAAARLEHAVDALTRRDFAYPERPTATLTVEVPWWASPGAERHPAAAAWARRSGIRATGLLPWFEDAARPRPGAIVDGTPPWAPIVAPAARRQGTRRAGVGTRRALLDGAGRHAPWRSP